jgi:thioredoxin-related protein
MKKDYKNISTLVLVLVLFIPLSAACQLSVYSFEQIDSLQKVAPRNTVVFIHTDWCQYCQSMKNTTFKNKDITKLLNESFWFADLNAEEKRDITFHDQTFRYKPTGQNTGVHELAEQLGLNGGKLSYPSLCVLNAKYEIVFQHDQFLSADKLLLALDSILKQK